MTPYWLAHALYVLRSIESVQEVFNKGESYCQEPIIYQGILRLLQTLFESAHKLPDDIKQQHPNVSWKVINLYRNILVHDYLGDFQFHTAVEIITDDLPLLYKAMLHHIPNWDEIKHDYH